MWNYSWNCGARFVAFIRCLTKIKWKMLLCQSNRRANKFRIVSYEHQHPFEPIHVAIIYIKHGYVVECRVTSVSLGILICFKFECVCDTVVTIIIIRCLSLYSIGFCWKISWRDPGVGCVSDSTSACGELTQQKMEFQIKWILIQLWNSIREFVLLFFFHPTLCVCVCVQICLSYWRRKRTNKCSA